MDHISMRELFLQNVAQTSSMPLGLEVDRAEGVFIYDKSGKRYFDMNSGIAVSTLGHRHPAVIAAVRKQLDRYLHTMVYGEHIQSPQMEYARLLFSQIDPKLDCIYYLNSGSEVVEAGMKLIKRVTGRFEIIACRNAYHGSTQGAESLRSDHSYSRAFLPLLPGVKHIEFNNEEDLEKITANTAGVIVEPVQAEAGVIPPEDDYLRKLKNRCQQTGALLMLDEIQTGFGRTGHLFAHQKYSVLPDILAIGKAMGGGMPVSGLVASRRLLSAFTNKPSLGHLSTFGGHPVCCAAALANLSVLISEKYIGEVKEKESFIKRKLRHPAIKEVRSSGLMMAVEPVKRKYLKHIVNRAFERGVLIDYFLFNDRCFRLAPPLIYTMDQLEEACDILLEAVDYAYNKYK